MILAYRFITFSIIAFFMIQPFTSEEFFPFNKNQMYANILKVPTLTISLKGKHKDKTPLNLLPLGTAYDIHESIIYTTSTNESRILINKDIYRSKIRSLIKILHSKNIKKGELEVCLRHNENYNLYEPNKYSIEMCKLHELGGFSE